MKGFSALVVRFSMLATVVLAAVVFGFNRMAAQGVLMGGIASTIGFWFTARGIQKTMKIAASSIPAPGVAIPPQNRIKSAFSGRLVLRLMLYGAALAKGYTLDPVHLWGFWGVAGGLFVVRLVVSVFGLTGWDMVETVENKTD